MREKVASWLRTLANKLDPPDGGREKHPLTQNDQDTGTLRRIEEEWVDRGLIR